MVSRCDRIRVLQTASARHITARDRRQTFPEVGPVWSRSAQRTKKSHSSLRGVKRRSNPGAARIKRWIASLDARNDERQKGSGTPKGADSNRRTLRCGAAPAGAARLSAFHRGSCQGTIHPEGSAQARLRGRRRHKRRVAPASAAPTSSDAPRAPVIVPAGMMPEPPGCAGDEPTPAGTALAPLTAVSSQRPSRERDSPKM